MSEVNEQLVKSGVVWFEINFDRSKEGLLVKVSADERVEEFFKALGAGVTDNVEMYGRDWFALKGDRDLKVYRMDPDSPGVRAVALQPTYTLGAVTNPLDNPKDGRVNLSFLRFAGISGPGGVRFVIAGPYSREYVENLSARLTAQVRSFIKDYILPISVNLRISSQNV